MAAVDTVERVRLALQTLTSQKPQDPRLVAVLDLSQQLVDAMQAFFSALDRSVYDEFRYIGDYIAQMRREISALRPNAMHDDHIPSAGAELEAITRHTEQATNTIIGAAEAIMAADPSEAEAYQRLVNARVLEIFEACSFQDITGQRVRKVIDTLQHIEAHVGRFAKIMGVEDAPTDESERDRRRRDLLLNGPAIGGPETKQSDIDAMFEAPGKASQDDIDKLFD